MSSDKLTAKGVAALKPKARQYKVSDGKGMYLQVMPNGSKYWRMAYRMNGIQKTLALGTWPEVSLAEAREQRTQARRTIYQEHKDPMTLRKLGMTSTATSFEHAFDQWQRWMLDNGKWTEKTATQIRARAANHALPLIGGMGIDDIVPAVVKAVADKMLAAGKRETARKVCTIILNVMDHAARTGMIEFNRCATVRGYVSKPDQQTTRSHAALTEPEAVGELLRAIRGYNGDAITRAALQLLPLLFTRPGELRHARWADIDLPAARWEIPAAMTKTRTPLVVPLATQAQAIIRSLQPITGHGVLLFPGMRSSDRPISDNTLNAALRRLGYDKATQTAHGFRATARTMLAERLDMRTDHVEMQLGHRVRDHNGTAYNRTQFLDARREMMQAWADYLDDLAAGACT